MNRISQKRIGVDGIERDLNDIRNFLVGKVEGGIRGRIDVAIANLNKSDADLAEEIKNKLHDILSADVTDLNNLADYYDKKYPDRFYHLVDGHWTGTDLGKALLAAFNYDGYREGVLVDVARYVNVKTCPYCNMHYTLYSNEEIKGKRKTKNIGLTRFQFDHFFDKLHYPMLSMSFYNLIPSCAVCNQRKSAKKIALDYHPYYSDINKQFHFELTDPLGPYTASRIKDEVDISLIPESGVNKDEFENYEKAFHLKSLYSRHGDVVQEVFDKAYEAPYYLNPSNFDFLSDRTSEYLKRLWLGNYTTPEEQEKRPMAKFMQDIWDQAMGEKSKGLIIK